MSYKEQLILIFKESQKGISYTEYFEPNIISDIEIIANKCFVQKGVFTVLVTLSIYKILHPKQDIRKHQSQIKGGFSGRTIDTQFITPTLKELGLPSMAESGWLTRSLEQPYAYTLKYNGKISNKSVKKAFLELVDSIETKNLNPKYLLVELFKQILKIQKANKIIIKPLKNPEKLIISKMITILNRQFSFHYDSFGGSKLPVLAFYAIYKIIVKEFSRYNNCTLKKLGSHTASDRTSKSSGDIEVYRNKTLFESVEIKLDKQIDANMLRIAKEKIIRFNPKRYYIFSFNEIKKEEKITIENIISEVKNEHGCQIVINGILPTLKYYMRLISNLNDFFKIYSNLIQDDKELKTIHKHKWNELVMELQDEL